MLTAEKESGQVKAHNYWQSGQYGNLALTYLSEHRATLEPERIHGHYQGGTYVPANAPTVAVTSHSNSHSKQLHRAPQGQRRATVTNPPPANAAVQDPGEQPYVIVRRFTLARSDRPFERMREITQLQYSNWPDFGAPAHPAHLLGLVEQCDAVVRQSQGSSRDEQREPQTQRRGERRPVLVHCSAGCGRTGTFCTVDSVVEMIRKQRAWRERRDRESKAATKDKRSAREATPMELDESTSPAWNRSGRGGDPNRMSIDGGAGFFASVSPEPKADSLRSPMRLDSSPLSPMDGNNAGEDGWLERDDIDLVEKVVEEFRLQRLSMVQSLRQFVLCYESVMEWMAGQMPKTA